MDTQQPRDWTAERARQLCDRHRGIGADGVLLVGPADGAARASMRVLNADGSEPEMCGNGLRCVALHLALAENETRTQFDIETGAGTLGCTVERASDEATVAISMGRAIVADPLRFDADGTILTFDRVSTGNPHAILFDSSFEIDTIDRLAPRVSASISTGSNIEFVRQTGPDELDVIVWERGVGRTMACGTGAVATAVAAATRGRVPFERPVQVRLPGGVLKIQVSDDLQTQLEGPAVRVFQGELTQ